jgi:hypothetical protein
VKPTLKQRKHYIKSSYTRYAKRTHKFGIRVPRMNEEALAIDKETNTRYWQEAIQKEMKNTRVALRLSEENETVTIGYKWIKCHLIFVSRILPGRPVLLLGDI